MITKRKLKAEIEQLKQDNATLRLLTKAYMRRNAKLEEDIAFLNASLDAFAADSEKWHKVARKADERRKELVRSMGTANCGDRSEG